MELSKTDRFADQTAERAAAGQQVIAVNPLAATPYPPPASPAGDAANKLRRRSLHK
jgi:hypothetical protein